MLGSMNMAETAKLDKSDQYEAMFLLGQSAAADLEAGIKLCPRHHRAPRRRNPCPQEVGRAQALLRGRKAKARHLHHQLLQGPAALDHRDRTRCEPQRRLLRVLVQQGRSSESEGDGSGRAAADHPRRAAKLGTRRSSAASRRSRRRPRSAARRSSAPDDRPRALPPRGRR